MMSLTSQLNFDLVNAGTNEVSGISFVSPAHDGSFRHLALKGFEQNMNMDFSAGIGVREALHEI